LGGFSEKVGGRRWLRRKRRNVEGRKMYQNSFPFSLSNVPPGVDVEGGSVYTVQTGIEEGLEDFCIGYRKKEK
jgi:hypothetical protein